MLILARKSQESVVIGAADNLRELLRVTVLEVRGGSVRLGFKADDDVAVHREEVWERVRAERRTPNPKQVAQRPRERMAYID